MNPVPLEQIANWAGGKLQGGSATCVTRICTDSRALRSGDLFLALRGENFDGHAFILKAAHQGAAGVVAEEIPQQLPVEFGAIKVADTLLALQRIAANYRRALPLKVVAITGSNGKTSTKDFTAAVLGEKFCVVKTEGNLNNHIGLPLTMLRAGVQDEIGVFEIGMNHPGEVAPLAALAAPEIAIITNVGMAHIEFMGTLGVTALEKGMLAEAVPAGGCVILNASDEFTPGIAKRTKARVILAGIGCGEVQAREDSIDFETGEFTVVADGVSAVAKIPTPARHMVENALLAIAAGRALGLSLEQCAAGLAKTRLTKGRLEQKVIRDIRVIDDSYNANPDSMLAALHALAQTRAGGRRIAVLGKMGELGAESERGHRLVGEAAGREKIDCIIGVGAEAASIVESAQAGGVAETHHVATTAEAAQLLRSLAKPGDAVLVKGSRAARMETVVEGLAL